ncbi:hypothetical protein [Marinoscillum pacificum]|uniref:hypothetical protein n=1 Tax=Marinoscillum pacificum TaxID=392723 RepID=UPI0021577158|nr:hypothetical protein [Marinoscillum pacificum]
MSYFDERNTEKIYEILSGILKLKFKTQIKGSGIQFTEIHKMINLQNQKEEHLLFLDNTVIRFRDNKEFISKFCEHLKENIKEFNREYEELREQEQNSMFVDKQYIWYRDEHISHCGHKQLALLDKMREFLNNIREQEEKSKQNPKRT